MARRRFHELRVSGVATERVGVVLNRYTSLGTRAGDANSDLDLEEAKKYLNREVILSDDHRAAREARLRARLVDEASALGKAFRSFARSVVGEDSTEKVPEGATKQSGESMVRSIRETLHGFMNVKLRA